MKNIQYLFPFLLLSFIMSCSETKELSDSVTLVASDTISFSLDESTYYFSKAMYQFEDNGKEYLYFQNTEKGKSQLIIFDVAKREIYKTVPVQSEGPNGMTGILGGYPLDMDHYIITSKWGQAYLVDGEGNVMKRIRVWDRESFGKMFTHICFISIHSTPAVVRDSMVYFSQEPVVGAHTKEEWAHIPMFAYFDLKDGSVHRTNLYYPPIFEVDEKYPEILYDESICYGYTGKDLVISLTHYDSIMVSSDFDTYQSYNAKSRYFSRLRPRTHNARTDLSAYLRKESLYPSYYHLLYDKYRDVFYRFVLMPYEIPKSASPFEELTGREFSIIILNNKYEIIGETKFPGNTYAYRIYFIGKGGLYLSLNNQGNPDFDESTLKFRCLKLQDKK